MLTCNSFGLIRILFAKSKAAHAIIYASVRIHPPMYLLKVTASLNGYQIWEFIYVPPATLTLLLCIALA